MLALIQVYDDGRRCTTFFEQGEELKLLDTVDTAQACVIEIPGSDFRSGATLVDFFDLGLPKPLVEQYHVH